MSRRRSVRDEMMRGSGARPALRRRRRPLAPVILLIVAALVVAVFLLAQVRSPASSEDAGAPVSTGAGAEPRSSEPAADATVHSEGPTDPTSEPVSPGASGAREVRRALDALSVVPGRVEAPYDRELFGQAWYDADRNGCDTRNDILRRDLREVVLKDGTNGCKVLSGVLDDWYSGTTVSFVSGGDTSGLVQIDHVVPLSWAWQHGADSWSEDSRIAFANDPRNLNATIDTENLTKSDSGPSAWLPGADVAQCLYVQRFTAVLSAYSLGIDLRDRAMIRGVLDECETSERFGGFDPVG